MGQRVRILLAEDSQRFALASGDCWSLSVKSQAALSIALDLLKISDELKPDVVFNEL
jgi:hypothetical protein